MIWAAQVLAAVLWLAPGLGRAVAEEYADIIAHQAARRDLDPLLVVAYIHTETSRSWKTDLVSKTYDHGLMALHVSRTSMPQYRGMEWKLWIPVNNIRIGTSLMSMWRNYHEQTCRKKHHWIGHMQWGYRVRSQPWTTKVLRLHRELVHRFRGQPCAAIPSIPKSESNSIRPTSGC